MCSISFEEYRNPVPQQSIETRSELDFNLRIGGTFDRLPLLQKEPTNVNFLYQEFRNFLWKVPDCFPGGQKFS